MSIAVGEGETKEVHSKLYLIEYGVERSDSSGDDGTDASQQTFVWAESDSPTSAGATEDGDEDDTETTVRPATAIVGSRTCRVTRPARGIRTGERIRRDRGRNHGRPRREQ